MVRGVYVWEFSLAWRGVHPREKLPWFIVLGRFGFLRAIVRSGRLDRGRFPHRPDFDSTQEERKRAIPGKISRGAAIASCQKFSENGRGAGVARSQR